MPHRPPLIDLSRFRHYDGPRHWLGGLLLAGLVLLGGCRAAEASSQGRVVISYWEKWGGFEAEAMREIIRDFNRSQNRIEVRFLSISPIDVKLMLAASGGNPPDLCGIWEYNIPDLAEKGALLPLDEALAEAGLGAEHYVPAYWALCRHRGFTWALPSTPGAVALYYNKRLFREVGLDPEKPPRTLAEVEQMNQRLTRVELLRDGQRVRLSFDQLTEEERASGRYEIVQIGHQPNDVGGMQVGLWGYWFGGKYWDEDRQITANHPGIVAAYQWLRDNMVTYGVDALRNFGASFGQSQSAASPFLAGKGAMVVQGPWYPNFIENYAPGLEWGVAPFPAAPGVADDAPMTLIISDMLVIPRGAKHPREAFEFLRYTQRREVAEKLARLQRKFTALRDVSPEFLAQHPNPAAHFFSDLARSPNARAVPRISIWRDYEIELSVAAMNVRFLIKSPEDALRDAQDRVQWRFDRVMRRWDIVQDERLEEWREHARW